MNTTKARPRDAHFDSNYLLSGPHWSDKYLLTSRARNCLIRSYPTEADLRAAWPMKLGDHNNIGAKTIQEIGEALGLTPLGRAALGFVLPPHLPDPRLAGFSEAELRRELSARRAKIG